MAKAKTNLDPLESAAVEPPPTKPEVAEDAAQGSSPGEAGASAALTDAPPAGAAEPELPPVGAAEPAKRAARFEVERAIVVSWNSSMLRLQPGDVVSDETHGDGAVERLRMSGVALRAVDS